MNPQTSTDSTGFVLTEHLESMKFILDGLGSNVFVADGGGKIVYANSSALEMLGVTSRDEIGLFSEEPVSVIGQPLAGVFGPDMATLLSGQKRMPLRTQCTIGGGVFEAVLSGLYDEGHKLVGYIVVAEDVTEQLEIRRENERSRALVHHAPSSIVFCEPDGSITYMNPAAERLFEQVSSHLPVPSQALHGQPLSVLFPVGRTRQLGDPTCLPWEERVTMGDMTLDVHVGALLSRDGAYEGMMAIWQDVTDQVSAQQSSDEAARRAEEESADLQARVGQLLSVVDGAARGDLSRQVTVTGDDAIGRVARGLSQLLDSLRQQMTSLSTTARDLSTSANRATDFGEQMGTRASSTAGLASRAAGAADQVKTNVHQVAVGAEQLGASIRDIAHNAHNAAAVANQAVSTANETNATIEKLGESSKEIGKVVRVITAVAQQTNLLALNATIEAARAGDAGKGFAVVANEVKELAKKTASATEDISEKIDKIQADTEAAVTAIEHIGEIISEINGIQAAIAGAVEQQSVTTAAIGRNATAAARSSAEIAESIVKVSKAANETQEGVTASRDAAQDLRRMASALEDFVRRFSV